MGIIRDLPATTTYTPEQALHATARDFPEASDLVVVGWDVDGAFIVRSSRMTREQAVFLLEKAKQWALG
jgi:hypothetical protein